MKSVAVVKFNALNDSQSNGLYRLRHAVFFERLNWEVPSKEGMERDEFDTEHAVYILAHNDRQDVVGCMRLIPTTQPYMLKDVFPELLYGQQAPEEESTWEVSRFAINIDGTLRNGSGVTEIAKSLMQGAVRFALENNIHRGVLVTTVAIERMVLRLGINMYRIGPPKMIGKELSVACVLLVDNETVKALFGQPDTAH